MKTSQKLLAVLLALSLMLSVALPAFAADILAPKNVKAEIALNGTIVVTWDMPSDRERSAVASARVEYSTDQTTWKTAATVTDTYAHTARITSFEDGGNPLPGTTYYISVRYVSKLGVAGSRSNVVSIQTAGTAPTQPTTQAAPGTPATPTTPSTPTPTTPATTTPATQPAATPAAPGTSGGATVVSTGSATSNGIPAVTNIKAACNTVGSTKVTMTWGKLSDSDLNKVSGLYIDVSTDQKNWKTGTQVTKGYYETTVDTIDGDALKPGTTYYFRLYYYYQTSKFDARTGKNIREFGPETIISFKVDDQVSGVLARWNTLKKIAADGTYKFTEKSAKYDKHTLVKGTKVVYTCPYYTVTIKVTAANAKKANYTATIKCKSGYENYFYFDEGKTTEKGSIVYADYYNKGAQKYTVSVYANTENVYELYGYSRYSEYSDEMDKVKKLNVDCPLYFVLSQKLTLNPGLMEITKNSINFGAPYGFSLSDRTGYGTIISYRVSGAEKWTKKKFPAEKSNGFMVIKKLKASTLYEFKLQAYETEKHPLTGKNVALTEDYAKTYKFYTGFSTAPEIQSVKINDVKTGVSHTSGYWDYAGHYHEGRDDPFTTFNVTVTLKNRPKSLVALKCLNAFSGGVTKGKGDTFTVRVMLAGNRKGESVSLSFVGLSNAVKYDGETYYLGESTAATKTVTLK